MKIKSSNKIRNTKSDDAKNIPYIPNKGLMNFIKHVMNLDGEPNIVHRGKIHGA